VAGIVAGGKECQFLQRRAQHLSDLIDSETHNSGARPNRNPGELAA
jgi:hypothetical protein